MQQQLNSRNPIFTSNNQHALQGWNNINPKGKQYSVSVQKIKQFMKYVFEKSKNQLQMEIDEDTDFIGMIEDYLEETQQVQKQSFTLQEAVNLLNWAVDPEQKEEQQTLSEKEGDIHQSKLIQNQKNVPLKILKSLPKQPNQNSQEIKILIGYDQQLNQHQINSKQKHPQSVNNHHKILDWDKLQGLDNNKSLLLYKQINSSPTKKTQKSKQNYKGQNDQLSTPTHRKPQFIKESLAKISKQSQSKIQYKQKTPLIKLDPSAPEMKYIKKQKIQFKNKKSKPQFNPQKYGLKLLFKFYCGLNSQFHQKKHLNPTKATFDGLQNKVCLLYMHNFMLLCKDFDIIQAKRLARSNIKNIPTTVVDKDEQNDEYTEKKEVWDRDKLSNYFKKQADYSLNITYDQFVQIMLHILRDKIQVEEDEHQNFGQSNDPQPTNDEGESRRVNIDPFTMELCKFFKVDTAQNSEQTLNKLKVQYKILQPQQNRPRQKNAVGQLNGHFQQHIKETLKSHQLEKEKARIQVKEKYLSKYSALPVDSYSSFKAATTQVNSLNSIYGSAPKLLSPKFRASGVNDETYTKNMVDNDIVTIRNKNAQEFHSSLGNIIKEARNQVMSADKENLYLNNHKLKQSSNAQSLAKSKFTHLNSKDNFEKSPIIGFTKLQEIRQQKDQDPIISSIILKNTKLQDSTTNRSYRMKLKSKDTSSPLLQRIGCHEDDDLLNKYFDQEKHALKAQLAHFST